MERTRSCRTLELGSFARGHSCSVLLPDSKNYPVEVNANDIEGIGSRELGSDPRAYDDRCENVARQFAGIQL